MEHQVPKYFSSLTLVMVYTGTFFSDGGFTRMKRYGLLVALAALTVFPAIAQDSYVAPPESLIVDGVPKIPSALAETAGR